MIEDCSSQDNYLYFEDLGKDRAQSSMEYRCSKCPSEQLVTAVSTTRVKQLPSLLLVAVNQPQNALTREISLADDQGSYVYSLFAIYCYMGSGTSGHYYAVIVT